MSRLSVACIAVVSGLALGGCGYDAGTLEEDIAERFGAELEKFDVRAESVSCPDEIEDETGYTFECTLSTNKGQEFPVEAEVTDAGDIEYGFSRKTLRELAFGGG